MSPGHAPPETFDELIRVTRPDGRIVISLRVDDGADAYTNAIDALEKEHALDVAFRSVPFASMPFADPSIEHAIYVLRVVA